MQYSPSLIYVGTISFSKNIINHINSFLPWLKPLPQMSSISPQRTTEAIIADHDVPTDDDQISVGHIVQSPISGVRCSVDNNTTSCAMEG